MAFQNIEPKMVELIMNEIMDSGPPVSWDDIAGLELAKTTIQVNEIFLVYLSLDVYPQIHINM